MFRHSWETQHHSPQPPPTRPTRPEETENSIRWGNKELSDQCAVWTCYIRQIICIWWGCSQLYWGHMCIELRASGQERSEWSWRGNFNAINSNLVLLSPRLQYQKTSLDCIFHTFWFGKFVIENIKLFVDQKRISKRKVNKQQIDRSMKWFTCDLFLFVLAVWNMSSVLPSDHYKSIIL